MADRSQDQDALVSRFMEVTGATSEVAAEYLSSSGWEFESAITEYFDPETQTEADSAVPQASAPPPIPSSSDPSQAPAVAPKKKFATLGDLNSGWGGAGHAGHNHDGDDSDDSDENQDLYAGGEKSGLAVENPDDLKRKILEKAKKNVARPGGDDARPAPSHFKGTARTLGGDDAPSEVVEDPNPPQPERELVHRHLHFWEDGFSVDDGPLFRLDDPNNAAVLAQIKSGRAPLSILNVLPGQEVDVKLEQHNEKYVAPKKKYKPFEGTGHRLGSPTPGVSSSDSATIKPTNTATASTGPPASADGTAAVNVTDAEPVISLQVRLGDGTRLVSRFNTSHTIGDVYNFVNSANIASRSRPWVLMTTFPSKELQDKSQQLGDLAEFKRGGVVIQKWQ